MPSTLLYQRPRARKGSVGLQLGVLALLLLSLVGFAIRGEKSPEAWIKHHERGVDTVRTEDFEHALTLAKNGVSTNQCARINKLWREHLVQSDVTKLPEPIEMQRRLDAACPGLQWS
jgi:hypothetical protein